MEVGKTPLVRHEEFELKEEVSIIASNVQEASTQFSGMEVIEPCKDDIQEHGYAIVENKSKIDPHEEGLQVYVETPNGIREIKIILHSLGHESPFL